MHKYVSAQHVDPVVAVALVLEALPKAPKHEQSKERVGEPQTAMVLAQRQPNPDPNLYGSGDVTATVKTDPEPDTIDNWLPKP